MILKWYTLPGMGGTVSPEQVVHFKQNMQVKRDYYSNGYHWHNYVAVKDDGLLPLFSDIYSTDLDEDCQKSENMKIMNYEYSKTYKR